MTAGLTKFQVFFTMKAFWDILLCNEAENINLGQYTFP